MGRNQGLKASSFLGYTSSSIKYKINFQLFGVLSYLYIFLSKKILFIYFHSSKYLMISIEDIGQLVHQATTKKKNSKYELLSN
jgi:hypothetical protein